MLQHLISPLSVSSPSVHQLRADCSPLSTGTLNIVTIPDAVTVQFDLLKMTMYWSKHVEDYNVIYIIIE